MGKLKERFIRTKFKMCLKKVELAMAEKFPAGVETTKRPKNSKKDRKIAKEDRPMKPLSTISVTCMKIQGGAMALPMPAPMAVISENLS